MGSKSRKRILPTADPSEDQRVPQEQDWIARIRADEVGPFAEVFTTYHERLCHYAEGYVGSSEIAKEIVSDVFLWIWEHRTQWQVKSSLASYLYGAVRHRAMNHLKHEKRARRAHALVSALDYSPGMAEPVPSPDEELYAHQLAVLIERTIDRLPERPREAFLLQRQHGLSYAEIAGIMGISVSTVEKHMIRALNALREGLSRWTRSE